MNFARSAMAPEISAGVMIANINWKAAKTRTGIGYTPPLLASSFTCPPRLLSPIPPYQGESDLYPKANSKP